MGGLVWRGSTLLQAISCSKNQPDACKAPLRRVNSRRCSLAVGNADIQANRRKSETTNSHNAMQYANCRDCTNGRFEQSYSHIVVQIADLFVGARFEPKGIFDYGSQRRHADQKP